MGIHKPQWIDDHLLIYCTIHLATIAQMITVELVRHSDTFDLLPSSSDFRCLAVSESEWQALSAVHIFKQAK